MKSQPIFSKAQGRIGQLVQATAVTASPCGRLASVRGKSDQSAGRGGNTFPSSERAVAVALYANRAAIGMRMKVCSVFHTRSKAGTLSAVKEFDAEHPAAGRDHPPIGENPLQRWAAEADTLRRAPVVRVWPRWHRH